jgi:dolichyl-phosphate beta-glucosyltransferase
MKREDVFLSLIIPLYNEENRFEEPLPSVFEYCSSYGRHEILFVDDGSTDATSHKLSAIAADCPSVRIIRLPENRGKGAAVLAGLLDARGELHLFSDADFSTPITEADKLLDNISSGYDIAIGSRGLAESNIVEAQPWYREAAGKMGNLLARSLLPLDIEDTQCGFKMLTERASRLIAPRLHIPGFAFDMEMLVIAQQQNLAIAEIPVIWRNVLGSKVRAIHNFQVLRDLLRIRYRVALGAYSAGPLTS